MIQFYWLHTLSDDPQWYASSYYDICAIFTKVNRGSDSIHVLVCFDCVMNNNEVEPYIRVSDWDVSDMIKKWYIPVWWLCAEVLYHTDWYWHSRHWRTNYHQWMVHSTYYEKRNTESEKSLEKD